MTAHVEERSAAPALAVGATLEVRYVLERLIARGGSSSIWRACDARTRRLVAVKAPSDAAPALHAEAAARLHHEARVLAGLAHAGVVACYDSGTQHGLPYLVLEHVHGVNLAQTARDGVTLRAADATRVALEVARALAHVHAAGIVHGDVKPQHVMLDARTQRVVLVDFGDARVLADAAVEARRIEARGTAAYAAPERAASAAPTAAADVYALGVVIERLGALAAPHERDARGIEALALLHDVSATLRAAEPSARGTAADAARALEAVARRFAA